MCVGGGFLWAGVTVTGHTLHQCPLSEDRVLLEQERKGTAAAPHTVERELMRWLLGESEPPCA